MRYRATAEFEVEANKLYELLIDPTVTAGRFESAGDRDVAEESRREDADGLTMTTTRRSMADLPAFARRLVPASGTVHQVDVWRSADSSGSRTGTSVTTTSAAPVTMRSDLELTALEVGRCRYAVEGAVTVKLPLIGGRLAKWAASDVERRLRAELAYLSQHVVDTGG